MASDPCVIGKLLPVSPGCHAIDLLLPRLEKSDGLQDICTLTQSTRYPVWDLNP